MPYKHGIHHRRRCPCFLSVPGHLKTRHWKYMTQYFSYVFLCNFISCFKYTNALLDILNHKLSTYQILKQKCNLFSTNQLDKWWNIALYKFLSMLPLYSRLEYVTAKTNAWLLSLNYKDQSWHKLIKIKIQTRDWIWKCHLRISNHINVSVLRSDQERGIGFEAIISLFDCRQLPSSTWWHFSWTW